VRDFVIDPAVWRRLNQLLDEALDLPRDERTDWLASVPPEAEPLKPRLSALLAAEDVTVLQTLPKFGDDVSGLPVRGGGGVLARTVT
jgi:hypothetical protein